MAARLAGSSVMPPVLTLDTFSCTQSFRHLHHQNDFLLTSYPSFAPEGVLVLNSLVSLSHLKSGL